MNKRKQPRRSSLFMLELIIAILFFAVSSAVCVQLFVKAHDTNRESNALSFASRECSNITEIVSGAYDADGAAKTIADTYHNFEKNDNILFIYFNDDYDVCESQYACYQIKVALEDTDSELLEADVTAYELSVAGDMTSASEIYSLNTVHDMNKEDK